MFSWISLALALLKLVNGIMTWARERELISQGQDQAIAEMTQQILIKTTAGKAIMEKVNAMDEKQVDAGLHGLEPADPAGVRDKTTSTH
jgi:hypothetical protein